MKTFLRAIAFLVTLLALSGFTECYKPVTKSQLPPYIKTVAVPAFQNTALRFKIEHRFTDAVMKELIRRGHGLGAQRGRGRSGEAEQGGGKKGRMFGGGSGGPGR